MVGATCEHLVRLDVVMDDIVMSRGTNVSFRPYPARRSAGSWTFAMTCPARACRAFVELFTIRGRAVAGAQRRIGRHGDVEVRLPGSLPRVLAARQQVLPDCADADCPPGDAQRYRMRS